jgi:transposase
MPRESPYSVLLSAKERIELERIVRKYTAPYCIVVRAKIALMASEGLDNKTIGERLSLPRQIVSKWRKRFFEERLDGLEDKARPGRPSGFSPSHRCPG